jgi:hypothetical protein
MTKLIGVVQNCSLSSAARLIASAATRGPNLVSCSLQSSTGHHRNRSLKTSRIALRAVRAKHLGIVRRRGKGAARYLNHGPASSKDYRRASLAVRSVV